MAMAQASGQAKAEGGSDAVRPYRVHSSDGRPETPHRRRPGLLQVVLTRSKSLRRAQSIYVGLLDADLIEAMKDVSTSNVLLAAAKYPHAQRRRVYGRALSSEAI